MSHVRGRIAVDVQFTDSTTSSGVRSLKTLTLQDATEYASGKVAIIAGTVGTAVETVFSADSPTAYKDATGNAVTFTSAAAVQRMAVTADNPVEFAASGSDVRLQACSGRVAVTCLLDGGADAITVQRILSTAGTASYTLVLYGS